MTLSSPWVIAVCVAAFVPYALFVLLYGIRSPWYATMTGRTLMLSQVAIMLLLGHVLVVLGATGDYPWRLLVWAALFVLLSIAGSAQLFNLLRLQRRIDCGDHPKRRATDTEQRRHP